MIRTLPRKILIGWGNSNLFNALNNTYYLPKPTQLDTNAMLKSCSRYGLSNDQDWSFQHAATKWHHSLFCFTSNRKEKSIVLGYGLNSFGQLNPSMPSRDSDSCYKVYESLSPLSKLVVGKDFSAILGSDKKLKLLIGGNNLNQTTDKIDTSWNIDNIYAGMDHFLIQIADKVYGCGWNCDGQLGSGITDIVNGIVEMNASFRKITKISTFLDFTLILADGKVYAFGNSEYGQCMTGMKEERIISPTLIHRDDLQVVDIAAGDFISALLTNDGQIYYCGYLTDNHFSEKIEKLECENRFKRIWAGKNTLIAEDIEGKLFIMGYGLNGQLGTNRKENEYRLTKLDIPYPIVELLPGIDHFLAICNA